jgi:addiction module HigA family antidote
MSAAASPAGRSAADLTTAPSSPGRLVVPPLRPGRSLLQRVPAGIPVRAPWHPGRFLSRNYLEPLGLSQSEAARALGMSRRRLHEIVHGQRAITPDTAIRCALLFGTDAAFWLALQSAWDSFHAWKTLRATPHATLPRGAH